jgi:hypothetical protein
LFNTTLPIRCPRNLREATPIKTTSIAGHIVQTVKYKYEAYFKLTEWSIIQESNAHSPEYKRHSTYLLKIANKIIPRIAHIVVM